MMRFVISRIQEKRFRSICLDRTRGKKLEVKKGRWEMRSGRCLVRCVYRARTYFQASRQAVSLPKVVWHYHYDVPATGVPDGRAKLGNNTCSPAAAFAPGVWLTARLGPVLALGA